MFKFKTNYKITNIEILKKNQGIWKKLKLKKTKVYVLKENFKYKRKKLKKKYEITVKIVLKEKV